MNNEKFYNNLMVAVGCAIGIFIIVIAATIINGAKTNEKVEGDFYNKCAAACSPNAVYSTKYNRCECNAMVVVREVK